MRTARPSNLLLLVLVALLMGCGGAADMSKVALGEGEQAEVRDWLLPRFELAVAPRRELADGVARGLDGARQKLNASAGDGVNYDVRVIDDPDIDAGCLPGGLVWLSEGLLAVARDRDEVIGALVFASRMCPAASRLWRQRDDARLVEDRENHWLYQRYRDYRLPANAPLYNLMVTASCSRACAHGLDEQILAAGVEPDAWRRLLVRIHELSPDAALLLRLDHDRIPLTTPEGGSGPADDWLASFHQRRDALLELADSRRHLWADSLLEAYRAGLRARRQLPDSLRLQLHQAELDLANRHPDYGQRILKALQKSGETIPHAGYWWGWVHLDLRRREEAEVSLKKSLDELPRVTAHYRLGDALLRLRRLDEARTHYNTVLEAGELHPEFIRAQARLDSMDES